MIQVYKSIKKSPETTRETVITPYYSKLSNWWLNGFLHRINFGYEHYLQFKYTSKPLLVFKVKDFNIVKKIYSILKKSVLVYYVKEYSYFLITLNLTVCKVINYLFFAYTEHSYSMLKLVELTCRVSFNYLDFFSFNSLFFLKKSDWFTGFSDLCEESFFKINIINFEGRSFFYFSFFLHVKYFISNFFLEVLSVVFNFKFFLYPYFATIYYSFFNFEIIIFYFKKWSFKGVMHFFFIKMLKKYLNVLTI